MKRSVLALALAYTATVASAQPGPTTQSLTCDQARSIVASQGAVVLHTGSATYDRFVRDTSFCSRPNVAQPTTIRTADAALCALSVCRETTIENAQ